MRANLPAAVALIRRAEGGYVDHPSDPGGSTNYGITIATFRAETNNPAATCADLKKMPWSVAEAIYQNTYWKAVNADNLPPGVDVMIFDHGVNAGPDRAARLLQKLVGTAQDGKIGKLTLAAAFEEDIAALIDQIADARLAYYRTLKTWPTFGRGWTARVADALEVAADAYLDHAHEVGPELNIVAAPPLAPPIPALLTGTRQWTCVADNGGRELFRIALPEIAYFVRSPNPEPGNA